MNNLLKVCFVIAAFGYVILTLMITIYFDNYKYELKNITQGYSLTQMKDAVATCEKDLPRSQHCVIVVSAQPVKEK